MGKPLALKHLLPFFVAVLSLGPIFGQQIVMSAVDYPPYTFPGNAGSSAIGLASEIATEAGKASGIDVRIEIVPMARAGWYIGARKHQALLGLADWVAGENFEPEVIDILNLGFIFYYKRSQFPAGLTFSSLEELRPYRIGNIRGSSTLGILEGAGITPHLFTDLFQAFRNLDAGRIDAVVGGDLSGQLIVQSLFPEKAAEFASTKGTFYTRKVSIVLRKEDSGLVRKFREGLATIYADGTYLRVVGRYCPPETPMEDLIPENIRNYGKRD